MVKNKLPISSLISIIVISIGAFFILMFIAWQQDNVAIDNNGYLLLIVGLSLFVTGIALLFKRLWARTILTISIVGLFMFLIYTFIFDSFPEDLLRKIGFCILSTGIPLFFILLLYNEKVSIEFGDKHLDKETEDLLDHFE